MKNDFNEKLNSFGGKVINPQRSSVGKEKIFYDDQNYQVIKQVQFIDLYFDIPKNVENAFLECKGYYTPIRKE